MHARLIGYLQDNRDQIIENWLTEVEVPAPAATAKSGRDEGIVPYVFFSEAFDAVMQVLESGDYESARLKSPQLKNFIGQSCECRSARPSGRVCLELQDAGMSAFIGVFSEEWDTAKEFNDDDREDCVEQINHALSGFFGHEIDSCPHKDLRCDCPFSEHLPDYL